MSNNDASEGECSSGVEENPECSLAKAVEEVSQHGYAQTAALQEKQMTLSSLQSTLKDLEAKVEVAEKDLRAKVRECLLTEGEIEHLEKETEVLHDRCCSTIKENNKLQMRIEEEEENARIALKQFTTYREKIEGHRAAVLHAESQTEAQKELEKKRESIRILMQRKEELKEDLENPDGNTVQMEKKEIEALDEEIAVVSSIIEGKREKLQQEFELHTQLRKDIEIQNKRFEAIVRRLHCQTSRAQAVHGQLHEEICHLEKQLAELKRQLESSQDSAVGDH